MAIDHDANSAFDARRPDDVSHPSDAPERAVVVANLPQGADEVESLYEIRELLRTAGAEVIGTVVQRRPSIDQRTYVGSGKVEELRRVVDHLDPDIVVVDDELTPSQQRVLEDAVNRRVLDRTAVILDIFALHAHTAEGKMQVELAQLEYNLARMRGMWKHLERQAGGGTGGGTTGGVGTRGPGEKQLETDRRIARRRISQIRQRLKRVRGQRHTMRAQRRGSTIPQVALAGYTNAGKSTLLNALTGAGVSMANRLFETLDPTTRAYEEGGRRYLVTDTVGFIERLPHQLVDAFGATLEETLESDLVLLVADASLDPDRLESQIEAVHDVLGEIGAANMPRILVLNKIDDVDDEGRRTLQRRYPDASQISAHTGEGLPELLARVGHEFDERFREVELLVPYDRAGVLHDLYEAGAPVTRRDEEDGIHATAHVPPALFGRVKEFVVAKGSQ